MLMVSLQPHLQHSPANENVFLYVLGLHKLFKHKIEIKATFLPSSTPEVSLFGASFNMELTARLTSSIAYRHFTCQPRNETDDLHTID